MTEAQQAGGRSGEFSKIKEVVSGWSGVRQCLRGGDAGQIVPVVVLKDRRTPDCAWSREPPYLVASRG